MESMHAVFQLSGWLILIGINILQKCCLVSNHSKVFPQLPEDKNLGCADCDHGYLAAVTKEDDVGLCESENTFAGYHGRSGFKCSCS